MNPFILFRRRLPCLFFPQVREALFSVGIGGPLWLSYCRRFFTPSSSFPYGFKASCILSYQLPRRRSPTSGVVSSLTLPFPTSLVGGTTRNFFTGEFPPSVSLTQSSPNTLSSPLVFSFTFCDPKSAFLALCYFFAYLFSRHFFTGT